MGCSTRAPVDTVRQACGGQPAPSFPISLETAATSSSLARHALMRSQIACGQFETVAAKLKSSELARPGLRPVSNISEGLPTVPATGRGGRPARLHSDKLPCSSHRSDMERQ
jgi:hypothetical protein